MKPNPLYLTQGDAFNVWSALGKVAYETKDKTVLDLEEMLRKHLQTYPMIVVSKE